MVWEEMMKKKIENIEAILFAYMPKESSYQSTVIEAMDYTISAGGKRIRPLLMQSAYEFFGGKLQIVEPFMAALEMIHTYSLIHDDLPALDNDDYRRGRKTAHIVYGEAMAILAGDSLLNYAYETAAKAFSLIETAKLDKMSTEEQCLALQKELAQRCEIERAMQILAHKPGIYGMIGGQVADVELTGKQLDEKELAYIYKNKTGALIEAAMMIGAVLAGAGENGIENMAKVAYNIGMAFQIQDDILDETATFEELGKPIHSDEKNEKVTYVTIYGLEASKKEVERLSEEAIQILKEMDGDSEFMEELIRYMIHRKN